MKEWSVCTYQQVVCAFNTRRDDPYLQSNDILSINFSEIMISEDTITSGRGVLHDSHDLAIFKGKPNVIGAVLLHSDGALKRPKDDNINIEYSNYASSLSSTLPSLHYLSRTANFTLSAEAFLTNLLTLSSEKPAMTSPLICRTWSPNLKPAMAAGEFFCT